MLTADQRKELEALEAEMRADRIVEWTDRDLLNKWADRIAAVLANGGEEG